MINEDTSQRLPLIFYRLIIIILRLFKNPKIRNSIILNAITQAYISVLYELKSKNPEKFSSLEPYQQFSSDTFNFIGNELSKDNNLIEIIDVDYWKDRIFKEITDKEEFKLLKHSIRSLILYSNSIQIRKKRLHNLK